MSSVLKRRNILQLMRDRELNDHVRFKYALKDKINSQCISKLGLIAELEGHRGCVNCLQWNENGSILASASDDYQVILWDPFLQKIKTTVKTLHRGNIFTVKFIPSCNDDIIVTGAGDWNTHTYNVTTGNRLSVCTCSRGRVKRIAVVNDTPSVFWSASEDGNIRQYDMRISHECTSDQSKINLVSIYNDMGSRIEAKCLDINQLRTEQLAVGANDPYVRLYDRRMIRSLSSFTIQHPIPKNPSELVFKFNNNNIQFKNNNTPDNIVQYFVPGHIHLDEQGLPHKNINIGITYLTFSPDGQELLVNYGSEYVYLYNLLNQEGSAFCNIPKVMKARREYGEGTSMDVIDEPISTHTTLPENIEKLKLKANYLFELKDYTAAINLYNEAIDIFKCSVLFSNRAAAYIKRKWHGDYYAALKDCVTALKLEPNHMKAHFRLAVCLYELNQLKDSKMYLEQFTKKYPSYKTSAAYKVLHNDILEAQRNEDKNNETKKPSSERYSDDEDDEVKATQPEKATLEGYFRNQAKDYHRRYYGHCNTSTDIKEANFFGKFIVAGSDDGLFFIWDKNTENSVLVLRGDNSIVNCLQPHPSEFMLATSGIDNEVKLWGPLPEDKNNTFEVRTYKSTALINQRRMLADPFEEMMRNMHRPALEEFDMDSIPPHHYVNDEFYNPNFTNQEFYTCRTS